jgi:hypothetical protein
MWTYCLEYKVWMERERAIFPSAGFGVELSPLSRLRFANETGDYEVYVRPFPGPRQVADFNRRWALPKWSRTSEELFSARRTARLWLCRTPFLANRSTPANRNSGLPGSSQSVNSDLHSDGKRFAVPKVTGADETSTTNKVTFVFSFFDELRRKAQPQK